DMPLFSTRIFETEYFDLERVEVLRGPQGTLFGRNATSGVVNFVTAKPELGALKGSGEFSYGNYNEIRLQGMVNVPLGDTAAFRVAGFYLKRDGYTENLFDGNDIDDRDMYAIRGSFRWEPTDATTIDLMGYYFREDDSRMRIQKQLCQRDPTGVLGCLPGRRANETTNANSTFVGTLSSREFLTTQGGPGIGALGLGSLYGPDGYLGNVNPSDPRQVNTDFTPEYFTDELHAMARIEHDFGSIRVKASGMYQKNSVDSRQDYNLSVQNASVYAQGLNTLQAYANGAGGPALRQFGATLNALLPNGANGGVFCTSETEESGTGAFGGNRLCGSTPNDYDRSTYKNEAWTGEVILTSDFDGRFNFLVGGIYSQLQTSNLDYYVNSFGIDYIAGVLGTATALGQQGAGNVTFPNVYLASPFFRNNQQDYTLDTWGLFGEGYFDLTDSIKITAGLRYNNDRKFVRARTALASFPAPYGIDNAFDSPFVGGFDFDPGLPGNQLFQERTVSFKEWTGRFVIDWRITD
ncbi:MAG: TonB-dependent receptor, partial [Sandaracinobacteroides sp.]